MDSCFADSDHLVLAPDVKKKLSETSLFEENGLLEQSGEPKIGDAFCTLV